MSPEEEILAVAAFYQRVARGTFPADRTKPGLPPMVSDHFRSFCSEAARRHRDGIEIFGDAWRSRDNMIEGREEQSDGLNYVAYDVLQHGGIHGDREVALALEEARYLYLANKCNRERAAKRRGSP